MATSNYFSVGGRAVFFDDFEPRSIERAYAEACALVAKHTTISPDGQTRMVPPLHTYRETIERGSWDEVPHLFFDRELPPRFRPRVTAEAA